MKFSKRYARKHSNDIASACSVLDSPDPVEIVTFDTGTGRKRVTHHVHIYEGEGTREEQIERALKL